MGPRCTRILADYVADMIEVEAPEGDSSRYTGVSRHRGMSRSFQHDARDKRSIAMDLIPGDEMADSRVKPGHDGWVNLSDTWY